MINITYFIDQEHFQSILLEAFTLTAYVQAYRTTWSESIVETNIGNATRIIYVRIITFDASSGM